MIDAVLASLASSARPLLVCDVDEVILEFLDPFHAYLESVDHRLHPDSFRLHGNIRHVGGEAATAEAVEAFQEEFFRTQDKWQKPARNARETLERLSAGADIVLLTAMPPRHQGVRRALLDLFGFHFPMIATEEPKGPVVNQLISDRGVPAAFVDDIFTNLHSVRTHAPDCLLINLMANDIFRAMAPDPGERIHKAESWLEAELLIRGHFGQD
ncbi:hypothetical protein [Rhizobium sp. TRM95796]|uniref:hypothetical protein n=1 Tax=Rhizobium sp. TRM95796 TaxID=2979862 RepID=UPI0021E845F1|nr:hypothetical protein [Rhizobium sp. TRM95796]MCV3765409.1 hypothetical protein [Rhizobium sp. TRM95796]